MGEGFADDWRDVVPQEQGAGAERSGHSGPPSPGIWARNFGALRDIPCLSLYHLLSNSPVQSLLMALSGSGSALGTACRPQSALHHAVAAQHICPVRSPLLAPVMLSVKSVLLGSMLPALCKAALLVSHGHLLSPSCLHALCFCHTSRSGPGRSTRCGFAFTALARATQRGLRGTRTSHFCFSRAETGTRRPGCSLKEGPRSPGALGCSFVPVSSLSDGVLIHVEFCLRHRYL